MKITLQLTAEQIAAGYVEVELFTATEARKEISKENGREDGKAVGEYTWADWVRRSWVPGYRVDRTELLYTREQLARAKTLEGSPIKAFFRNRNEHIEEVTRG
jgi:hypothetical protein